MKRDLLARGIFTSVADLARKLRRFITKYNDRAKPVRWAYADPTRRSSMLAGLRRSLARH